MMKKYIHSQDAYYKLSPKNSGETSINLSQEILQLIKPNLEKGSQTKISLKIYREDFVKAIGNILKLLPLYTSSSTSSSEVVADPTFFSKDFSSIATFFGNSLSKDYEVNLYYRQDGRIYFNELEDSASKFNMRRFLVEENSTMVFNKKNDLVELRLISDVVQEGKSGAYIRNVKFINYISNLGIAEKTWKNYLEVFVGLRKGAKEAADLIEENLGSRIIYYADEIDVANNLYEKMLHDARNDIWNQTASSAFKKYVEFLQKLNDGELDGLSVSVEKSLRKYIVVEMNCKDDQNTPKFAGDIMNLQKIFFGAPGTGKSHEIKKQTAGQSVVRTTFHPDSDYSTFVGAYKPTTIDVPLRDVSGHVVVENGNPVIESKIVYEFVEQAFLKAYVNAWTLLAENKPQFLIVEEINRGNCAQIFGDLFQLLDRNDFGFSDYPIIADSDLKKFLSKIFKNLNIDDGLIQGEYEKSEDGKSIAERVKSGEVLLLPKNLYIWATMNTSDQSLFPIDSAFKRRWDWKYIPIDTKKENWSIKVNGSAYSWSDFLEKVNEKIGSTTSSEDKKLGFYFCKACKNEISADRFVSKALFYIYNDVFKDYGYEDPMFKNDGKVMPFQSFYNTDGSVNETVVDILLKNLNVLKNSEVIAGDDEESEDSDSSGKDLTRYTINGEGSFPKRQVATEAIKKYIELNPGKTAAEVVADWKTLGNVVSHFVETQEEYDGRQDNSKRSNEVACGSEKFYVSHNGWEPNSIQRLMNAVNAKDWGITLAKAE